MTAPEAETPARWHDVGLQRCSGSSVEPMPTPAPQPAVAPGTNLADIREALQARPLYFHGTRADFAIGETLRPRAVTGSAKTTAPLMPGVEEHPEADQWVHVTDHFEFAWAYAWKSGGTGEPKVLVVKPTDDLEHDPEHSPHMPAYRCSSALVLLVDDQPSITEEKAQARWEDITDA